MKRAGASDNVLVTTINKKLLEHLGDKDLRQSYFAFLANAVFVTSYLNARADVATKHAQMLGRFSIF